MAETIRADRNASETGKSAARAKAEAAFSKPADGAAPPRVLENVASTGDMQKMFALVKQAEATYETALAAIREKKTAAKAVRDKALSDAADAMKSRGISKRLFTDLVAMSKRKEEEVVAEIKSWVWAVRAVGMPVGSQLAFFEETFNGEDEALRRAEVQGYDAFSERKSQTDNPFHPSSPPGQRWLHGFQRAMADATPGMQKN